MNLHVALEIEVGAELCLANVASVLAHPEVELYVLDDVCVLTEKFAAAVVGTSVGLFSSVDSEVVFVVTCFFELFPTTFVVAAQNLGDAFGLLASHFVDFKMGLCLWRELLVFFVVLLGSSFHHQDVSLHVAAQVRIGLASHFLGAGLLFYFFEVFDVRNILIFHQFKQKLSPLV